MRNAGSINMFKLLTEEAFQKVSQEYSRRRAILILIATALVLAVTIIGLLPSYVLSTIRSREVEERSRITDSMKSKGDEAELDAWLTKTNLLLQTLSPKLDVDRPSELIEEVIGEKIDGVYLTSFSWAKDEGKSEMFVRGIAKDRQSLLTFKERLNTSGNFSTVTLPISELASDKDIDFQINLSLIIMP